MLNYVSSRWFPVNQTIKNNILDVVNLTFNFQTSINYPIQTPPPFAQDVHVDIAAELTRIRAQICRSFSHNQAAPGWSHCLHRPML